MCAKHRYLTAVLDGSYWKYTDFTERIEMLDYSSK